MICHTPDGHIFNVRDKTKDETGIYPVPPDYWRPVNEDEIIMDEDDPDDWSNT